MAEEVERSRVHSDRLRRVPHARALRQVDKTVDQRGSGRPETSSRRRQEP